GYYHGRLTESNNYRDKKSIKLPESEQLLYKDEDIPAIVSEELWDRVNAILKEREEKYKKKSSGTQSRFPYSGKIKCEEHGTYYYRKMWKDRKVPQEGWCCKVYLAKGRKACPSPHLYTRDLDAILTKIGADILENNEKYQSDIDELISLYAKTTPSRVDYSGEIKKLSADIAKIDAKKDKVLELYTDDDISKDEYLESKDKLDKDKKKLSAKIEALKKEQSEANDHTSILEEVRKELSLAGKSKKTALEVAQSMLKEITVLKESEEKCVKIRVDMRFPKTEKVSIIKPFILYSDTEVSPIVGTEKQSEELVKYLLSEFETDPSKIWESNIFGKSLYELVNEGLHNKLSRMPDESRNKLRETLQRIINEGSGGLICIIL
ncbi:MAG: sporulation stage IV protein A, partial [Clostridia bacterium]|nr:sporulation stage IV protein A [Clostridia bacterium]